MRDRWGRFLTGYVILRLRGRHLEAFLNESSRTVPFFGVKRYGPSLAVARVLRHHVRLLRPIARRRRVQVRLLERVGLPFMLARAGRHPFFWLGLVVTVLLFLWFSSYVWVVDVVGAQRVRAEEIRAEAARLGLHPGAMRRELDLRQVEDGLLLAQPLLTWADVQVEGVRAQIRVAERSAPPLGADTPGDLVARRDGVIVQIVAFQGRAEVAPGDTVARGQVLIRGELEAGSLEHQSRVRAGESPVVRAEGVVRARVGYDSQVEVPLVETVEELAGSRKRSYGLEVAGRSLMIGRKPDPARVVSWRIPVQVGPWRLPVALRMDERWPVSRYQVERTIAQAFAEAEARARRQIQEQLDGEVTILEETLEQYQPAPDRVGVRLRVETLEEIGVFVPYR
ncbi:MAG TPA: sporulation protein YqfD [Limnochorda sp.]